LGTSAKFGQQGRELRRPAAARQNHPAAALLGQTAHAPNRGVTVHVGHHDDDVATLHERAQGRRAATGKVSVMVLEVVPGTLREVLIKPLIAIEAADDTDVHGGSKELLLRASTKLT